MSELQQWRDLLSPYGGAFAWVFWLLVGYAALEWLGKDWVRQLFESENQPSIRKLGFFLVVLAVLRFADFHAQETISTVLLFASSLVIAGTAKVVASRFAPKPHIDPTEQPAKPRQSDEQETA